MFRFNRERLLGRPRRPSAAGKVGRIILFKIMRLSNRPSRPRVFRMCMRVRVWVRVRVRAHPRARLHLRNNTWTCWVFGHLVDCMSKNPSNFQKATWTAWTAAR